MKSSTIGIAIHGGAGALSKTSMTPELEVQYRSGLAAALDRGYAVLDRGGGSVDAVNTAVRMLEDDERFNAGRGAVFTLDGTVELDAALMEGSGLQAGAVAGLKHIRNPIDLARMVMERSRHVMIIGAGAEKFALEHGMPLVANDYFHTQHRRDQLEKSLRGDRKAAADMHYFGTVGAVARDRSGNLAAATSTGGLTGKQPGRVGDTPVIGAGTYANNNTCAVSGTGQGEFYIRLTLGHEISALVEYKNMTLDDAVGELVQHKLKQMNAEGGVIAIDKHGHIVVDFNTEGMFRGARDSTGRREVGIYR